jgi:FAS-associated factor 2
VDAPGLCKVAVKLPDGSRCERRFLSGDTVGAVFDFVDTLEGAAGAAYSLVSNFPRRVFTRDGDADVTLAEGGLAPQAMLMYQNLDDE